ncbi:MAG TPA: polyhydroxyalkanoate synthesis regulator DNA-binding domain-containing protein [Anaerolineae bacterium]|nr:polyhydroxyalkanoate synthesis regulator DNA-binding domain-containing protein [Anaerolineae bacterium]
MPLIKRYANRKLYDTESKRYITLDGIAEMIRQQQDVKVIDHETGEDITALTQAQIIFEQERKLRSGIPRTVFTNIIQTSSDTISQVWHALIPPDEMKRAVDAEIEKRVQLLMKTGQLGDDDGIHLLDLLLTPPLAPELEAAKPDRTAPLSGLEKLIKQRAPSQEQLEQLTKQVEALTAEVERLTKLKLPRPPKPPSNNK